MLDRTAMREYMRKRRAEEPGVCGQGGCEEPVFQGKTMCLACLHLTAARNAVGRAKRQGIPFESAEYLAGKLVDAGDTCPCCGVAYYSGGKGTSKSIDKVIPERGYVRGNTLICCTSCNTKFGGMSLGMVEWRYKVVQTAKMLS